MNTRYEMEIRGISILKMAQKCGVSWKSMNDTLNKKYEPRLRTVVRMADVLGVPIETVVREFSRDV